MSRKSKYTMMQEHINAQEVKHTKAFTAFLGLFNQEELARNGYYGIERKESAFPITEQIIELGLDRLHTAKALKNLESKGNLGARELLFEELKEQEHNLAFQDLLQEFRLELMEQEQIGNLFLVYDDVEKRWKITIEEQEEEQEEERNDKMRKLFKELYSSVTGKLYSEKRKIEKVHISYEVQLENGEKELVDMLARKKLARYVHKEDIYNDKEFRAFLNYLKSHTIEKAVQKRLDIIDGFLSGYTYQDISDFYHYKLSTIGKDAKAIRALYKDFFGIHNLSAFDGIFYKRDIIIFEDAKKGKKRTIKRNTPNYGAIVGYLGIPRKKLYKCTNYHRCEYKYKYDLYFSIGADEQIKALENRINTENLELLKIHDNSPIVPKRAMMEKSEKLYTIRQEHCKKRSIRSRVVREEQAIRQELERIARYEKPQEEHGAIRYEKSDKEIKVFYGKSLIHTLPIAR